MTAFTKHEQGEKMNREDRTHTCDSCGHPTSDYTRVNKGRLCPACYRDWTENNPPPVTGTDPDADYRDQGV